MCKLDPKVDLVFKKLFASEENKDILMSLINSMLPKEEQMTEIKLENPYNLPDYIKGKLSILDIKAKDEKGTWYNIEIRAGDQDYFEKRALSSKTDTDQTKKREKFSKIKKTIMISILDFKYFDDNRFHRRIVQKDIETNELYEQLYYIEFNFLELPKFEKKLKLLKSDLERWTTFFNHSSEYEKENIPEELSKNPAITKAIKQLDILYLDKKEQEIYED